MWYPWIPVHTTCLWAPESPLRPLKLKMSPVAWEMSSPQALRCHVGEWKKWQRLQPGEALEEVEVQHLLGLTNGQLQKIFKRIAHQWFWIVAFWILNILEPVTGISSSSVTSSSLSNPSYPSSYSSSSSVSFPNSRLEDDVRGSGSGQVTPATWHNFLIGTSLGLYSRPQMRLIWVRQRRSNQPCNSITEP